ncbi:MAG: 50S ribosomal protein L11 methyltransferase [Terriglobia bacterium]|jgi:protein arginine N-methyltransferase 1
MHSINHTDLFHFHAFLLADRGRTESYQKAIAQTGRPGDVVLDVGTGTGILAFFSCQAGARKVYAVEASPAIELAQQVCDRNGLRDRVVFLHDLSFDISLPEQVDAIITDIGADFGLEGGVLGSMIDARIRFLRKGGSIIPHSLQLFIAPVEVADPYHRIDLWKRDLYGLDFSPIRSFAVNNYYAARFDPQSFLSDPAPLVRIPLAEAAGNYVRGNASCIATRAGVLHGIAGWAVTELAPGISFSNSPINSTIQWQQRFFPLETTVLLRQGDCLGVTFSTNDGEQWRWQVKVSGQPDAKKSLTEPKRQFEHSSFQGFPLSKVRPSRQASSHKPKLSPKGEALLFLLGAFNGERTIEELETELLRRYGDCFPSRTAALQFLREIVTLSA